MGPEPSVDAYARIAEWYDVEHDGLGEDVECLASLLVAPPSGRAAVLEIGAGTGRIAAALATAGHEVTGVEPSARMRERGGPRLARLPERVRRRIRIVPGTATEPGLPAGTLFDAVIFGLNALAHLTSADERGRALRVARDHLRPEGQLLIDLDISGPRWLLETAHQLWWQGSWPLGDGDARGDQDQREQVTHFVTGAQGQPGLLTVTHIYDVHTQGGVVRRTQTRMTLALLARGEVELALLHAGFAVAAVYGGYDLAVYDDLSARAIFDARSRRA
ncbi:MAG TPA: class I SAM-dependent methyltransferase [Ktedonobacterales bacterium]|nr:class I SAM-dependent methyltransferase [Ktedonobacterales bacterium]